MFGFNLIHMFTASNFIEPQIENKQSTPPCYKKIIFITRICMFLILNQKFYFKNKVNCITSLLVIDDSINKIN